MNYLNKLPYGVIAGLLLLSTACEEVDQERLQEQYLQDKVEDYRDFKWRSCMKEVMKEAEAKSDSFFVAMAKKQTFDSTRVPNPIQRPRRPQTQIREDSVPLGPLLKSQKDSLSIEQGVERDSSK